MFTPIIQNYFKTFKEDKQAITVFCHHFDTFTNHFIFETKDVKCLEKNHTTQIVIKKYSYHDRSIVKYLGYWR